MKIETERTIIRSPKKSDVDFYKNLWADGKVMKYVGFPRGIVANRDDIMSRIEIPNPAENRLVVEEKSSGETIAETGWGMDGEYQFANGRNCAGLEIKIKKSHWGKGFGTEILRAVIEHVFNNTDFTVVFVDPNIENIGAVNLYKKLGFKPIGKPVLHKKGKTQVDITNQYYELEKKGEYKLTKKERTEF